MIDNQVRSKAWKNVMRRMNEQLFSIKTVKPMPDEWISKKIRLPASVTPYPGLYDFDKTPWWREVVNHFYPNSNVRFVSTMKDGQSGFTTVMIGGILYTIENCPCGILFTAGDIALAEKTVEDRIDPVAQESNLQHLFRANVVKKTNNRTGHTKKKKEFGGGYLYALGTNSANSFRMFTSKLNLNDDYDTAPKQVGKEGSPKMVMKTRQNALGDKARTFMTSTPTDQNSNIYEQYLLGTQKKWHWPCPQCSAYFAVEWVYHLEDGTLAGMVWQLDDHGKLIIESVRYKCPHCGHLIRENEKYELNLQGIWKSTVEIPAERRHESYQKNAIINPPGFDGWVTLVEEWLAACPPGERPLVMLLKTFNNLRLGLPFAEQGSAPKVNELMKNCCGYLPGTVPDDTSRDQGNGEIILLTLACDINGVMNDETEDVRLDWELVAHSASRATYSVDHGSIGAFKRQHEKTKLEKERDFEREKWTITHGVPNSVWPAFQELLSRVWVSESGENYYVHLTLVDTGFGQKQAMQFVQQSAALGYIIYGVKGDVDGKFRPIKRDSNPVTRSREQPKHLYLIEVNQVKDDLAQLMALRAGTEGYQPAGFMNFPQARDGKYQLKSFFSHYEAERRVEELRDNQPIGYKWEKKNNTVANHFFDVRVYNLAAPMIYIDLVRRQGSNYKDVTWDDLVEKA